MDSRQRVSAALNHRQPDRVPIDFGATAVTGMHCLVVEKLRDHYGLEYSPVKIVDPYQMLGEIDSELAEAIGVDVLGISPPMNMFGVENRDWKEWQTPWGQTVQVAGEFRVAPADKGGLYVYPGGDPDAPPSAHMPAGGYFFDTIVRQEPFNEDQLDPEDNLEEFGLFSDADIEYWRGMAEDLGSCPRAVVGVPGGLALGDIALVPAPFLKHPHGIRDISEWYMSTMIRRDYVKSIFEKQTDIALANLETFHGIMGDLVDVVFVCGTDFGTQDSQFCSAETFRDVWLPYYRKMNDWIHANTEWKTFKHCCGSIQPLLPVMIEAGFDIINPVQVGAADMDPRDLKRKYGRDLVFWGGGVDTQKTLPHGKPADVREEVLRHCEIFGAGGGFVFGAIHNVQANVPLENAIAMLDAVREFNGG